MQQVSPILRDIIRSPQLPKLVEELSLFLKTEKQRRNEFYEWITDNVKAEFIEGEVIIQSPVVKKHNVITKYLCSLLEECVAQNNSGFVGVEKILVKLTRNDFEPDICFFKKEKAKNFRDDTMFFPAPDFVVEILSKSTEKIDRGVKFIDYALHGVKEYWIIDPDKEIVEQYENKNSKFELLLKVKTGVIKSVVVPKFEIPVKAIFNEKDKREALQLFLNKK
ncbi:MAG TPA: Uma2 family endonuclease [Flavipsychrobacter sp.]|nr:Uma2 family endonuclease [Flavipsychrobacter sp.]